METPEISFLCASYNHGQYVGAFLRSLFAQKNPCWECVVVDDCSKDNNINVICSLSDPRIRLVRHTRNEGMAKSLQDAFFASTAPIVALVASDDLLDCRYVEVVVAALVKHPNCSVVYTPLSYMNENGTPCGTRTHLPVGLSRQKLVSQLFLGENLLPSPGMAVRREAFAELLPLDISMIQFTDWQIHEQLLCLHEPILLNDPLVYYRVSGGSASARSRAVEFREDAECDVLMNTVYDFIGESKTRFEEYFGDLTELHPALDKDVPFFLGLLALHSPLASKRRWGYQVIMRGVATGETAQGIHERYGVDFSTLMHLSSEAALLEKEDGDARKVKRIKHRKKKYKVLALFFLALSIVESVALFFVWS